MWQVLRLRLPYQLAQQSITRLQPPPQVTTVSQPQQRSMAVGPKGGGAKGVIKKQRYFDVETDTKKLATHCCGLDYRVDGTDPPLKPDSEYPDWLWTMDVNRPLPSSDQLEPGTLEFFLRCREEYVARERVKGTKRKRGKRPS